MEIRINVDKHGISMMNMITKNYLTKFSVKHTKEVRLHTSHRYTRHYRHSLCVQGIHSYQYRDIVCLTVFLKPRPPPRGIPTLLHMSNSSRPALSFVPKDMN